MTHADHFLPISALRSSPLPWMQWLFETPMPDGLLAKCILFGVKDCAAAVEFVLIHGLKAVARHSIYFSHVCP
jgi:hypothetical protein